MLSPTHVRTGYRPLSPIGWIALVIGKPLYCTRNAKATLLRSRWVSKQLVENF